jgi:hypothetical protein
MDDEQARHGENPDGQPKAGSHSSGAVGKRPAEYRADALTDSEGHRQRRDHRGPGVRPRGAPCEGGHCGDDRKKRAPEQDGRDEGAGGSRPCEWQRGADRDQSDGRRRAAAALEPTEHRSPGEGAHDGGQTEQRPERRGDGAGEVLGAAQVGDDERHVSDVAGAEKGVGGELGGQESSRPPTATLATRDARRVGRTAQHRPGKQRRRQGQSAERQPATTPTGQCDQRRYRQCRKGDAEPTAGEIDTEKSGGPAGAPASGSGCGQPGPGDKGECARAPRKEAQRQLQRVGVGQARGPDSHRRQQEAHGKHLLVPELPAHRRRRQGADEIAHGIRRVQRPGHGVVPAEFRAHRRQQQRIGETRQAKSHRRRHGETDHHP